MRFAPLKGMRSFPGETFWAKCVALEWGLDFCSEQEEGAEAKIQPKAVGTSKNHVLFQVGLYAFP